MKAREIYSRSLALLGEDPGENTLPFEKRALTLINFLLGDVRELDLAVKGEKYSPYGASLQLLSLEDETGCAEPIALTLLPLGLASLLINEEEPARSQLFLQQYNREKESLRVRCRRGRRHKIRRIY